MGKYQSPLGALHYQLLEARTVREGAPLIVGLHGLVMDNLSSLYFTLAEPLTGAGFRLLLPDLLGHGMSARPQEGYALSEQLAALRALIHDVAGEAPVYFLGNSFGALLSLEFTRRWPEESLGLILIDAHLYDVAFQSQLIGTLSLQGAARDEQIATHFQSWLNRHQRRRSSRLAERARRLVEETSMIEALRSEAPTPLEALRAISAPVLALFGEESDARGNAEKLQRVLPQLTLRFFGGCSHSLLWEAGTALHGPMLRWLEETEAMRLEGD